MVKKMRYIVALLCCFFLSAFAEDDSRDEYYVALSNMSPNTALFEYMMSQMYLNKCGNEPSDSKRTELAMKEVTLRIALKNGNTKEAKTVLNSFSCE